MRSSLRNCFFFNIDATFGTLLTKAYMKVFVLRFTEIWGRLCNFVYADYTCA
jgi:hypothetical protein